MKELDALARRMDERKEGRGEIGTKWDGRSEALEGSDAMTTDRRASGSKVRKSSESWGGLDVGGGVAQQR